MNSDHQATELTKARRELEAAGVDTKAIATAFGLSCTQVNAINRRAAWHGFPCASQAEYPPA